MAEQITESQLQETIVARLGATHAEVADISGTITPPSPSCKPLILVLVFRAHVPLSPIMHPANSISLSSAMSLTAAQLLLALHSTHMYQAQPQT